jgi:GTP1/Obg family GTP-binding protein
MKKHMILFVLLIVPLYSGALDNPFTIKKERKTNRRSVKQHCCEYCAEIVKKMPTVNRLLAQLQRALIGKSSTEKAMTIVTHAQEQMTNLQEVLQQAIEDYWNSEKQGMWQEAPAARFAQLENKLKEIFSFLGQWSSSLATTVLRIKQSTKLPANQIKALTDALQDNENQLKKFIESLGK